MMRSAFPTLLAAAVVLFTAACSTPDPAPSPTAETNAAETNAAEATTGVEILDAKVNLMPGMGAAYLTAVNHGAQDDRLVRIESSLAEIVELHESVDENGVLRMIPAPDGFPVTAGARLALEPGGKHAMLIEPTAPADGATTVPLTLHFELAGAVEIEAGLMRLDGSDGHEGHGGMDHGAMDHGAMDHGEMDHGEMDHGAMDHGEDGDSGSHGGP